MFLGASQVAVSLAGMTSGEAEPQPLLSERERNESAQDVREHVPFDRVAVSYTHLTLPTKA